MRIAAIIKDETVVNIAIIGRDLDGDAWLQTFDGITTIPDPDDTYNELFITLDSCIAIETTNLEIKPMIGWAYNNNTFTPA